MADTRQGWLEGVYAGFVAGLAFGAVELLASALPGPLLPFRMAASVALGRDALGGPAAGPLVVGLITHLALSSLFGLAFAALNLRLSAESRRSFGFQSGLGLLFGLALWLVNFQAIGRTFYPWFLEVPQFQQALMHGACFGLPLALAYAAITRRVEQPGSQPQRA